MKSLCVLQVRGHSGLGKTTLIEKALPLLKGSGYAVGVLKHSSHHLLALDSEGKDTDRLYKAGAAFVMGMDPLQAFSRFPSSGMAPHEIAARFPRELDLVLVEGMKSMEMPSILLEDGSTGKNAAPKQLAVIKRSDPNYVDKFLEAVTRVLRDFESRRTVRAGLLVGGKSRRMGNPKALLRYRGKYLPELLLSSLEAVAAEAVLLGSSELPEAVKKRRCLPDIPESAGPVAGILSAFRWDPESAWIISAVDMPLMRREGWEWLLSNRKPGVWAVLPRTGPGAKAEIAGACYEPAIFGYIESLQRKGSQGLQALTEHPKVATPLVPSSLLPAWRNINTPEEWKEISLPD